MHCTGQNILHSVQIICKLSQYYQIKLYGNFNNITAGGTWCLYLNATCLLFWPFWLPCNEQFHSMNDSIITSRSAWIVNWPPNRTEADQGSKREGVYTLESEKFVRTYYYQTQLLGGADSDSKQLCVLRLMKIIFKQLLCFRCFFHYSPEHCSSIA